PRVIRLARRTIAVHTQIRRRHFLALSRLAVLVAACGPSPEVARTAVSSTPAATATSASAGPSALASPATPSPTVVAAFAPPTLAPPSATSAAAIPTTTAAPSATPTIAPIVQTDAAGRPSFSGVSAATPADVVAFLAGRDPRYPGADPATAINFSPSDILETMDTIVLDQVRQARGNAALQKLYEVIAADVLTTARDAFGDHWVLLPLDAGHGGKKGYFWDAGSEGTEAEHTRAVVAAMFRQVEQPLNRRILLRRVYNDDIADDFGLGGNQNRATVSSVLMRQARSAMLAFEARVWNAVNPDPASQVFVQEISVHFNAGAGGALVLHQGDTVRPE